MLLRAVRPAARRLARPLCTKSAAEPPAAGAEQPEERRQRLQSETAARVMQKEKQAESTRPGLTPCPKLPTACVHASSLLAVPCVWYR